jgi:hypothetical protein
MEDKGELEEDEEDEDDTHQHPDVQVAHVTHLTEKELRWSWDSFIILIFRHSNEIKSKNCIRNTLPDTL